MSAKILSGFDAPSTSSPAVGDEILFALSLDSPVGVENWYLHMTIAEISEDRKRVGFALTVFDPDAEWVVDASTFASKGKNTPLDGTSLKGQVVTTIVGGVVKYEEANAAIAG